MSVRTPFYMTHAPQPFSAVSTSVGSGKSRAAVQYIASAETGARNFLFVAPTIALVNQTQKALAKELERVNSARSVHLIHSQARADDIGGTGDECLTAINAVDGPMGRVVILTTPTFLDIVARIEEPKDWSIILDEAFAPLDFLECHLGADAERDRDYFMETLDVVADDSYRVVPRAGKRGVLQQIAMKKWRTVGHRMRGLEPFARAVLNPALRCELVLTERVTALLAGDADARATGEGDDESGSTIAVASFVTPEYFVGFEEVVFMSALFEHTILYALWRNVFGVDFRPHPVIRANVTRDLHREQGPYVSIGHLFHENDNASKHNLDRNRYTGQPKETNVGERVVDWAIESADAFFGERKYLLSVNVGYGYDTGTRLLARFPNAKRIPVVAHGLNEYQDWDNVAALAVCNPTPRYAKWIEERTGLTRQATYRAHRIHATYQAVGRSSVRNAKRSRRRKVFLTLGREDAALLHEYFEGSRWLGHVGPIGDLKALQNGGERRSPQEATLADAIHAHLGGLSDDVRAVSSREVKGIVAADTPGSSWRKAVKRALQRPTTAWGWQGASFVRRVDLYGFGEA